MFSVAKWFNSPEREPTKEDLELCPKYTGKDS
jgi:hypothetical protein